MSRKRSDKARQQERDAQAYLLVAIAVAAIIGGLSFFTGPELDASYCPKHRTDDQRQTTLIIDTTDKLGEFKSGDTLNLVQNVSRTLRRHERISVFIISSKSSNEVRPIFSACYPGDARWIDRFSKGSRELSKVEQDFEESLSGAVRDAVSKQLEAQESPLIEALSAITNSQYWSTKNRIFFVSDLLEHSSVANLYEERTSYEEVKRSKQGAVFETLKLQDSDVHVCLVSHPADQVSPAIQSNARKFWKIVFDRAAVSCVSFSCQAEHDECEASHKESRRASR